jgi:REP element-mobilizing transposase RayT
VGDSYQIKDQFGLYFLTFQVVGWIDVFSRKVYRDIIIESLSHCRSKKELEVFAYVVMTNHLHVIFRSKNGTLSATVRDFKRYTAKTILEHVIKSPTESRSVWMKNLFTLYAEKNQRSKIHQFWTHYNHAVELTDNLMIDTRLNYIHENPVRAGWVENPEEFLYSSARNYAEMEALIEVDLL